PLRTSLRARGAHRDGVRGAVAGHRTRRVSGARCSAQRRGRARADRRLLGVGQPHPPHPAARGGVLVNRAVVGLGLVVWAGMTLALAETRWARRISIARRLTTGEARSTDTTQLLADRAGAIGAQVARSLGVRDDLATR